MPTGRNESTEERLDRNWADILQELRVMQTGAQILTAFLITLPFQAGFSELNDFQRDFYLALLVFSVLLSALILTPVAVHRHLFGQRVKVTTVHHGHRVVKLALLGIGLLISACVVFIVQFLLGWIWAAGIGTMVFGIVAFLLVILPRIIKPMTSVRHPTDDRIDPEPRRTRHPQHTNPVEGTMTPPRLEIAVQDTAGARIAREHGADRVELCQALEMGGLTPSQGLIEACVAQGIGVHPLIRPRGGGYSYSPLEVDAMVIDIRRAVGAGARGVVIGALADGDSGLDASVLSTLITAARDSAAGTEVTVHRCVDVLLGAGADPVELVGQLIDLGVDRVLSSGGAPAVGQGIEVLHLMHEAAGGRLQIQAGGGIRLEDIPALARLDGIHLSARTTFSRGASGPGGGEPSYDVTSPELVAAAAAAIAASSRSANPDASTISDSDVSRAT